MWLRLRGWIASKGQVGFEGDAFLYLDCNDGYRAMCIVKFWNCTGEKVNCGLTMNQQNWALCHCWQEGVGPGHLFKVEVDGNSG